MKQIPVTKTKQVGTGSSDSKPREELTLDVYVSEFEKDFLGFTTTYYRQKSQKWTEEDSFPDYMVKAADLYYKERQRCQTYLHNSTEPKLLQTIDNELIGAHQMKLLHNPASGLNNLLHRYVSCDGENDQDLLRMYELFVRLPDSETSGVTPIAAMVQEFITTVGMGCVEQSGGKECDKLVERLVDKYHLFKKLVDHAFQGDHRFQLAMKEAFEKVVNTDVIIRPATDGKDNAKTMATSELMADYSDHVLKDRLKKTEEDTQLCLDNVVALFAHLQEKDVFRCFYQELLGKRLLLHDKVKLDWERIMIQKLKALAGAQYTNKMEKMLMDNSMQQESDEAFEEFCGAKVDYNGTDIKLEVQVLTRANWPSYSITDMKVPPEIQSCVDKYTEFYTARHDRTVLAWIHTLGKAQIELIFVSQKRKPTVTVSVVQAALMMQFNQTPSITYSELCSRLGLAPRFLAKYVKGLASEEQTVRRKKPEHQLLCYTHQPAGPSADPSPDDVISLNVKGLAKVKQLKNRYQMPLLEAKVAGKEQADLLQRIQRERVMNIDAQIVRIMKARQRMKISLLVMQVVDDLRHLFPVMASFVTQRVKQLADGAYDEGPILKLVADDEYEYLA